MTTCAAVLIVWPLAFSPPARFQATERDIVSIKGWVVDDETGKPIESFGLQRAARSEEDPSKVVWRQGRTIPNSYTIRDGLAIPHPNPEGAFTDYVSFDPRDARALPWLRVVADGYDPQPLTEAPFQPAEAGKTVEILARMRRGRAITGRVLDHRGEPAAGARLFLLRSAQSSIRVIDGDIGQGSDKGLLDPTITRALADDQGRFRITGATEAEQIGVSTATLYCSLFPAPAPDEEATLRLPAPATLRLPYNIAGDDDRAAFWLHLSQPEALKRRLTVDRNIEVANGQELVLADLPAGEYTLWRQKPWLIGDLHGKSGLSMRQFGVEPGGEAVVDFTRMPGSPLSGRVSAPPVADLPIRFVGIQAEVDGPDWDSGKMIEVVACDPAGSFQTASLSPGSYRVFAEGYAAHGPRYGRPFSWLNNAPALVGSTRAVIREGQNAPSIRIVLKPWVPRTGSGEQLGE